MADDYGLHLSHSGARFCKKAEMPSRASLQRAFSTMISVACAIGCCFVQPLELVEGPLS